MEWGLAHTIILIYVLLKFVILIGLVLRQFHLWSFKLHKFSGLE